MSGESNTYNDVYLASLSIEIRPIRENKWITLGEPNILSTKLACKKTTLRATHKLVRDKSFVCLSLATTI